MNIKEDIMKKLQILFLTVALMLLTYSISFAKATGACVNCHTMHNSQNGSAVESGGPYKALTKGNCVGCHTGTNDGSNSIPYVLQTSAPTYNFDGTKTTLAGGSFYWVYSSGGATDTKGHNVSGIASADGNIGQTPPGFNTTYTANGTIGSTWASNQLTCAGTYGCHGGHTSSDDFTDISGAHHADDSTIDGSTVGKSFRFLKGIKGTEDSDWEYTTSTSDHNGYYASDYNKTGSSMDSASINYLCAECHGDFHLNANVDSAAGNEGPWLRHPTDYDMNNASSGEYGSYPNASKFTSVSAAGDYFVDVPVGNTGGTVKSSVMAAAGDAVVLCVSCHRAHGSPYADLLRWDYSQCSAGGTQSNCGCFACHTTK